LTNQIAELARRVSPDSLVIAGGISASCSPRMTTETGLYDAVFVKDGEVSLVQFIETVSAGHGNLAYVRGLWYQSEQGQICDTGDPVFPNLDETDLMLGLEAVNLDEYNLASQYFYGEKTIHLITSRGCPHRCSFCVVHRVSGRRYASMSARKLIELLKSLKRKYGFRNFNFDNDVFSLDREFNIEFSHLILAEPELRDIHWKITTRADFLDEETLELMYKAGLRYIAVGLETADKEVLDSTHKNLKLEAVEKATAKAQDLGIRVRYFIMVGLPGQTWESLEATAEFIRRTKPDEAFVTTEVPYPGSDIAAEPERYGIKILVKDFNKYWMRDIRRDSDEGENRLSEFEKMPLVETKWLSAQQIVKGRRLLMQTLAESKPTPLAGLLHSDVKAYIIKALSAGYAQLGIPQAKVEELVEILSTNRDNPAAAISAVQRKLPDLFVYPQGKFHQAYQKYRSIQGGRYKWLDNLVPAGVIQGVVVDIGCANNALGEYLLKHFDNSIKCIVGLEKVIYKDSRMKPPKLMLCKVGNPTAVSSALPFIPESIDAATIIYTLHHIPYEFQIKELQQLCNVMRPGAKAVIIEDTYDTAPSQEDEEKLVAQLLDLSAGKRQLVLRFFDWLTNSEIVYAGISPDVPVPAAFRAMDEWERVFEEAGFDILEKNFIGIPSERIHRIPMGFFLLQKPISAKESAES
jgi:radical SAM superfamily enzyme YgiQ (UPF0313 family)